MSLIFGTSQLGLARLGNIGLGSIGNTPPPPPPAIFPAEQIQGQLDNVSDVTGAYSSALATDALSITNSVSGAYANAMASSTVTITSSVPGSNQT